MKTSYFTGWFLLCFGMMILLILSCKKETVTYNTQPLTIEGGEDQKIPYLYYHWMKDISDDKYLSELTIPGTHDSGADKHTSEQGSDAPYVICQDFRLSNQLDLGVRWFDIRLRYDNGGLPVHHGPYYLHKNFTDQLNNATDWLKKHPTETVIFMIKQEHSNESDHTFGQAVYDHIKNKGLSHFYLKNEVPKLGEVRGKMVIVRRFGNKLGTDFGLSFGWTANTKGESFTNSGIEIYVQDHYSLHTVLTKTKLSEIETTLQKAHDENNKKKFYINFTSGERVPGETIFETSEKINGPVQEYLEGPGNGWTRCGVVLVNFAGGGDVNSGKRNCAQDLVKTIIHMNFED